MRGWFVRGILVALSPVVYCASVTITLDFNGAQAQNCCNLCGNDYWCINNTGGCGTVNPSATQTFNDPIPPGNVITGVSIQVQGQSDVGGITVSHSINGTSICSHGGSGNNSCGACYTQSCTASFPCGLPGYNYGGTNTYTISASGNWMCWDRTIITFTYQSAGSIVPSQPGPISGPNPACAGGTATYSISPVAGATSYNWTVPAGWTINSGQGTTSISVTAGNSGGQICVTASNSCGTSQPSCTNVSVKSSPTPVGPISGPTQVCEGQTVQYSVPTDPSIITYSWSVPPGSVIVGGQGTNQITTQIGNTSGTVGVTITDNCGFTNSATLNVQVFTQSQGGTLCCDDTICIGGAGSITLSGYNGQIIKWQYSTDGGVSWIDLNYTGSTYNFAGIMDTTMYRAVVQNGPCLPAYSNPVTIYVVPAGNIPVLSPNASDLCWGDTVILHLTYDPLTQSIMEWQFSTNNGASWTGIPGWTADSLAVFAPVGTTWWRVKMMGAGGGMCADSVSTIAVVNIYPPSDGGTLVKDTIICEKEPFCLSVSGYVGTITNWEYSFDGSTWFYLTNTDSFLCVSNLTNSAYFKVRVKSGVCPSDTSNSVYIEVHRRSSAGEAFQNMAVCADTNAGFVYVKNYLGNVVGWLYSTDSFTWSWAGTPDDTLPFSGLTQNTWYMAIVQNGVCPPDTSNPVKIWVIQPPAGGTIVSDVTVCEGNNYDTLVLVSNTAPIIQWEYSTDGGYTWVAIQNATPWQFFNNIKDTTMFRVKVGNEVCPPVYSDTATVTTVPYPHPGTLFLDTAFCERSSSVLLYDTGYTGQIVAYLVSYNGGITWDTMGKASITNPALPDTIVYPDTVTATAMVMALVSNGVCPPVSTNTIKIEIVPKTNIVAVNDFITTPINSPIEINATTNDTGTWNFIDVVTIPGSAQVKITEKKTILYSPQAGFTGIDRFDYVICERVCDVCDTATITVVVGVYVPEGFSPDNDGINDVFYIAGIENYPRNTLIVYNRWGDPVFKASPYKNDWDGTSNIKSLSLAGRLPDGTYFWVLDLGDGTPLLHGTVEIRSGTSAK